MKSSLLKIAIVWIALLPAVGRAGSFQVIPIRLFVGARATSTALTVTNLGDDKTTVQLQARAWTQDAEGRDVYAPTKDLLFFPKMFTMQKEQEMIVRISYQGDPSRDRERTYRLFVEELPMSDTAGNTVQMPLRLGIPVFMKASGESERGAIEKIETVAGILQVKVKNTGNRHLMVKNIQATGIDSTGAPVFDENASGWYVLPGASRVFSLNLPEEHCRKAIAAKITLTTDGVRLQSDSVLNPGQCAGLKANAQ